MIYSHIWAINGCVIESILIEFSHQHVFCPLDLKAEKLFKFARIIQLKANSMEDLLNVIEIEIKRRTDYLHHIRFGNRIIFESKNSEVYWITIDTYSSREYRELEQSYADRFA